MKLLDGFDQSLELDVMGMAQSCQLPKYKKRPTDNQLYSEIAKAHWCWID